MKYLTTDTLFNGRIRIKQDRTGYRFSMDTVLLANQMKPDPDDTVLDLGTGCGIIPIILAYRHPRIKIYGVEIQKDLAGIAAQNVEINGMDNRITIHCSDMKALKHEMVSGPVDVVVSNPPYRKASSGRINPDRQRAVARHEIMATLQDVISTSHNMLHQSGRFITIYPAERITDLLTQMRSAGIEPKFLRTVHFKRNKEAKRIIVEGRKEGRSGVKVGPPLMIYNKNGSYSDEVEKMFHP